MAPPAALKSNLTGALPPLGECTFPGGVLGPVAELSLGCGRPLATYAELTTNNKSNACLFSISARTLQRHVYKRIHLCVYCCASRSLVTAQMLLYILVWWYPCLRTQSYLPVNAAVVECVNVRG
jgi:hypothetical protein